MFWVIFDTSTRRVYYRDVHNSLALPSGATLRYDYGGVHLSDVAKKEAKKGGQCAKNVLLVYAQDRTFQKGMDDPVGPLEYSHGLWVATRIATLAHVYMSEDRYYFDLTMLSYPATDDRALGTIIQTLGTTQDIPFTKWAVMSDLDAELDALNRGAPSSNWASIVDKIGTPPSQFSGDSFWRIAKITKSPQHKEIQPVIRKQVEATSGKKVIRGVQAVFPITELGRIAVHVESRTPGTSERARTGEPDERRTVAFNATLNGPLRDFNGRTLMLRRHGNDWIEAEIEASDRIRARRCDLTMETGPATGGYSVGPELTLSFQATKSTVRISLALLSAILGAVCLIVGGSLLENSMTWRIALIVTGVVLEVLFYLLLLGRVRLPAGK